MLEFGRSHDLCEIEKIKNDSHPIYIYGNGIFAGYVRNKLEQNDICVAGNIVDDEYWTPGSSIRKVTDMVEAGADYSVVIGIENLCNCLSSIKKIFINCCEIYSLMGVYDTLVEPITIEDYENNKYDYDGVFDKLEDEESRGVYRDYLLSKIEEDNKYIVRHFESDSYFLEKPFWKYDDNETFLDAGAYDGDTIIDFIKNVGKQYKKIFAIEPDGKTITRLKHNTSGFENIVYYENVLGDQNKKIGFSADGNLTSRIDDSADTLIEMRTIDSIVGEERVSVIKMDIEGAETIALTGASETIRRDHPLLFICIYHKKGDAYQVMNIIDSYYSGYHYFMRTHHPVGPLDVVLYAIPDERLVYGDE